MKDPRSHNIRLLLLSFLLTGAVMFCLLPVSYRRDPFARVQGRTSRIGERTDGEEIRHADEKDTEDLLLHLWREEMERHSGAGSLIGRRK